jgi:hypothetical protein
MPRIVVGHNAIGTAVGKLGVVDALVVVDIVPGLDVPVDRLSSWAVLWKLKV